MDVARDKLGWLLVFGSAVGLVLATLAAVRDFRARAQPDTGEEIAGDTCCAPGSGPRRAPAAAVPTDLTRGEPEAGRRFYTMACANCHDDDGSGARGRPTYPDIRDLREAPEDLRLVAETVVHGQGRMPAFGDLLSDAELRHLLAYVRSLREPG